VRNPLGVIRASVQLLEDARGDPVRTSEAAEVIKQEIDRLDRVHQGAVGLRAPEQADDGAHRPQRGAQRRRAVHETGSAKQSDVVIEERLQDDLLPVRGDPDQLKQVFLNLVTNAVQAMGAHRGLPSSSRRTMPVNT